ncbi:MAG: hypothetical protein L0177_20505 [Chloroflexi bacterium]|nr:hypothetical protein [Chloroflexota bacterium]
MSGHEGKVVVLVTPEVVRHESGDLFAARFPELGLTAYGRTEEQAWDDLKIMCRAFIGELRRRGVLERRLNEVGVRWHWAEEYPDDLSTAADTTMLTSSHWDKVPTPLPFRSLELVA